MHPKFNWHRRILRNAEPTVVVVEGSATPEPVVVEPTVTDAVQGATQIAALAHQMGQADPVLLARLDGIESRLSGLHDMMREQAERTREVQSNTEALVIAEVTEQIEETITEEPAEPTIVATPIPADSATIVIEEPRKRKSRWL